MHDRSRQSYCACQVLQNLLLGDMFTPKGRILRDQKWSSSKFSAPTSYIPQEWMKFAAELISICLFFSRAKQPPGRRASHRLDCVP
jgi:hypothetical protein